MSESHEVRLSFGVVISILVALGGTGAGIQGYVELQLAPVRQELVRSRSDTLGLERRIIELIAQVARLENETQNLNEYVRDIDAKGSRRWIYQDRDQAKKGKG